MDAMKILGSVLASGMLGRGSSGGNVLGSVLGSVLGGNQGGGMGSSGGLGNILGNALGGSQHGGGGGLGSVLGNMLGGAGQQQGGGGGMLGKVLGGLMGGGNRGQSGGMGMAGAGGGGLLDSILGGAAGQQAGGGGLGSILGASLSKYAQNHDPQAARFAGEFLPEESDQEAAQTSASLIIKAMLNAAKADGQVDAQEMAKITSNLGDDSEEANFIQQEASKPQDTQGLINSVPKGMEQQIYLMSLLAIDLDTQEEARYLDELARGLNISQETCNQLHEQLGVPTLYS